jgi:hypothetical protein
METPTSINRSVPDVVCGIVRLEVPEAWPVEVASTATTQLPGGDGGVSQARTGAAMKRRVRISAGIQR